jgi:putative ABC transport system permease protein
VINPGKESTDPSSMMMSIFDDSLTERDLESIKKKSNVPGLKDAFPTVLVTDSVTRGGVVYKPTIFGSVAAEIAAMFDIEIDKGEFFTADDVQQYARVALLGSEVKEKLFEDQDAIGEYITIKEQRFRVVGVMKERGQASMFNVDNSIILPWTTAQKSITGVNYFHEIIARAETTEGVDEMVRDIQMTLRENHGITDSKDDDFKLTTQAGLIKQVNTIMSVLTTFLTSVVAISLVVGGIGVMNIMLVSVTERTKEIGLRKALGATEKDVLTQFLIEAVMLTAAGGLIGIIIGLFLSYATSLVLTYYLKMEWTFAIPFTGALLGFMTSALVGLVFGIYPAKQAAHKDPIEALRYE